MSLERLYSSFRELFIQALRSIRLVYLEGNGIKHIILSDAFGCFEEIFFKQVYFDAKTISHADVVIDLGAHQGTFTIFSIINMKPHSTLISVEPNPQTYTVLLKNIHLYHQVVTQKMLRIYAINKAIYTSKENVKLKLTRWSETPHLSPLGDLNVQTVTFEELFSLFHHLKDPKILLKMDIEGTEHRLFMDGESLKFIGMCKNIAIETHGDFSRIKETLKHLGFKVRLREVKLEPYLYRKWLNYRPKLYTSIIAIYRFVASSIAKPKITIISAERQ